MASSKEYLEFVLEQLAELDEITYRAMMGEYIIYYRGKIVGGIYDDRLLVKPIKSAISYMPTATYELPYDGAREMLLVEDVDNKKFLTGLFNAMYDELPAPKIKKKKQTDINFRVDRIASKPEILAKDIIPMPDDFDIENYTKEVFFMFSGEKVLVDLRCDNSLMKTMVDRFGEDVTTLAYDMTSFRVQTEVSASPTFFGWVFGFNGKVQILAPESVKEQYRQMIAQADEDMQESE